MLCETDAAHGSRLLIDPWPLDAPEMRLHNVIINNVYAIVFESCCIKISRALQRSATKLASVCPTGITRVDVSEVLIISVFRPLVVHLNLFDYRRQPSDVFTVGCRRTNVMIAACFVFSPLGGGGVCCRTSVALLIS
jgi:hypothetical protein